MSYKFTIDSSAWVEYLGGSAHGAKIKKIIEEEPIATSIIAIAELADKFERENMNFSSSLQFIQNTAAIIDLTVPLALRAAKIKKTRREKKKKFGLADAIHLASALQEKAIFVTKDKDFSNEENVLLI